MNRIKESRTCLVLRHVAFEGLGVLAELLPSYGFATRVCEVGVEPLPEAEIAACDLLIVLGGPIGVYETEAYPFLVAEKAAIAARLALKKPTLGICLGAQLMAAALGAKVAPGPAKEIGYALVTLTEAGLASPLAALGDIMLYIQSASRFNATSDSTAHAVIEALCVAVARCARNSVESAAAMTEFVLPWLHQDGD